MPQRKNLSELLLIRVQRRAIKALNLAYTSSTDVAKLQQTGFPIFLPALQQLARGPRPDRFGHFNHTSGEVGERERKLTRHAEPLELFHNVSLDTPSCWRVRALAW